MSWIRINQVVRDLTRVTEGMVYVLAKLLLLVLFVNYTSPYLEGMPDIYLLGIVVLCLMFVLKFASDVTRSPVSDLVFMILAEFDKKEKVKQ